MASEKHIHSEDIVRLSKNKSSSPKLGLVLRSGDNISDSETSSDSEDDEIKVKQGEILVCWYPSGVEEVLSLSKVELVDRSLQPSDVVRHVSKLNQKGYVHNIQITADIRILGIDKIIRNVDCKKYILPLESLCQWTHISFGPWVGYIKKQYKRVVLWLKNGARCSIEGKKLDLFSDALDKHDEDCPFYNASFYPSQSVVGPAAAFQDAKWLTKIKPILVDQNKIKAVVESAKVYQLEVVWQVCGLLPPGCKKEDYEKPPDKIVTEEDIDKVQVFHQHGQQVQIGDKCFYVLKEEDSHAFGDDLVKNGQETKLETANERVDKSEMASKIGGCNSENKSSNRESQCEIEASECPCEQSEDSVTSLGQASVATSADGPSTNLPADGSFKNSPTHESDDGDVESDGLEQPRPKSSKQDLPSKPSTRRRHKRFKAKVAFKVKPGDRVCVEIIRTKTKADVMWQDGRLETNVDTLDLISIYHIDDHQFFPGYIVVDKRVAGNWEEVGNYGIIRSASDEDRTCAVRWFSANGEDLDIENDISVYDLAEHTDMVFNPGDLVVVMSGTGGEEHHGVAGHVAGMDPDGYVVVNWAGDADSGSGKHRPHELYKVESEGEDDDTENSSEDSSENESWETASENEHSGDEVPRDDNTAEVQTQAAKRSQSWLHLTHTQRCEFEAKSARNEKLRREVLAQAEAEMRTTSGSEENSEPRAYMAPGESSESRKSLEPGESSEPCESLGPGKSSESCKTAQPGESLEPRYQSSTVHVEALNKVNNLEVARTIDTDQESFRMLSEVPETHHFCAEHSTKPFTADNPRKFMSVVRKEILLLRSSLPAGIMIRGFDDALELFTALIMGPKDTPYEGGVFLFDIKLPADYPTSPPLVFFVSMNNSALNPNLYVDGTVCTSLLGTWSGKDSESWNEKSNLLQVFLSIQALILCKEPYFNEAGYEKHRGTVEGVENSRLYNEMVILHLISSMTAAIKLKHPVFGEEIKGHFQKHGARTLGLYRNWLSHSQKHLQSHEKGSATLVNNDNDCPSDMSKQQTELLKLPEFPLFPLSKGFCKCLARNVELFNKTLHEEILNVNEKITQNDNT